MNGFYRKALEHVGNCGSNFLFYLGGFQLEFVSINRVINHMICFKFKCSHWLKLQHSDWRANLVKDLKKEFPSMRALEFITGHVIYNQAYTYKFQLKTTFIKLLFDIYFRP